MYLNDMLSKQSSLEPKEKQQLKKMYEEESIIKVTIIDFNMEKEFFTVNYEKLPCVLFIIPFDAFNRTMEKEKDFSSYIDKYLGQNTYVKIEQIYEENGIVLCNRTKALDLLETHFLDEISPGDMIEAEYQNIAFRKIPNSSDKIEHNDYVPAEELGIYIDSNGMKGFLSAQNIPLNGRKLSDLNLLPGDKVKGKVVFIDKENRLFILSMKDIPKELEIKKTYLGNLIHISSKNHIFDVDGNRVFVSNKEIVRQIPTDKAIRLRITTSFEIEGTNLYHAVIS